MISVMRRKKLPVDVRALVLHEVGFKCANPVCRTILTYEIHHLDLVSEGGTDTPDNLIALCPNCHTLHHSGVIPIASLRAWKLILLSVNEAYDRKSVDILFALDEVKKLYLSGDGLLECAPLIAGGLLTIGEPWKRTYDVWLSERGKLVIDAWRRGDQRGVVAAFAK
jgi:hypothetical protein